ncbi:hypothetical protein AB7849_15680 [Rhodanobacter sp. 115]|uniref:hypothetical protein n=1 Tax=Rhodanobacter sp. FW021-MT20 TaxID=1162282 RepID=UPI0034E503FF
MVLMNACIATKEPTEGMHPVNTLRGHFVKRKPDASKVYKVEGYCADQKRWELTDVNDVSRCIYVKPGTLLFAGFTY